MTHWRRAAPAHSNPWRPWLTYPGSLTRRIVSHSREFHVELLGQFVRIPNEDEYAALGRPSHRRAFVREVVLHADHRPVVLAHSIVSRRDVEGEWRALRGLGTRPLAVMLFTDPLVHRTPFEYARVDARHPLWKRARQVFGRDFPVLWARRSLFRRHGRPLMVTEVFLPAIRELRR